MSTNKMFEVKINNVGWKYITKNSVKLPEFDFGATESNDYLEFMKAVCRDAGLTCELPDVAGTAIYGRSSSLRNELRRHMFHIERVEIFDATGIHVRVSSNLKQDRRDIELYVHFDGEDWVVDAVVILRSNLNSRNTCIDFDRFSGGLAIQSDFDKEELCSEPHSAI